MAMMPRGSVPLRFFNTALSVAAMLLASGLTAGALDLPVATHGFESWAAVVGKAMSFGGKNQEETLQSLQSFQDNVQAKMQSQAASLQKLAKGDFTDILVKLATVNTEISKPVFFQNAGGPDSTLINSGAGVSFGFSAFQYAPCAVVVGPVGVAVVPQGINIQPELVNIAPTGVNVQPQGVSIAPNLIVIGPYDTTVAGQGLNIAPALIAVAPTRVVINPTGPLAISDTLISATVPNPP